jgi:hypothetical protein
MLPLAIKGELSRLVASKDDKSRKVFALQGVVPRGNHALTRALFTEKNAIVALPI